MRITTQHSRSSYGIPVILSDAGNVMDYGPGLHLAIERLGWTRAEFRQRTGYSFHSIQSWLIEGVPPPAEALNALAAALRELESNSEIVKRAEDNFRAFMLPLGFDAHPRMSDCKAFDPTWVLLGRDGWMSCDPGNPSYLLAFTLWEYADNVRNIARRPDYIVAPMTLEILEEMVRGEPQIQGVSIMFDMEDDDGKKMTTARITREQFLERTYFVPHPA